MDKTQLHLHLLVFVYTFVSNLDFQGFIQQDKIESHLGQQLPNESP